jgi:hypothetical protein
MIITALFTVIIGDIHRNGKNIRRSKCGEYSCLSPQILENKKVII